MTHIITANTITNLYDKMMHMAENNDREVLKYIHLLNYYIYRAPHAWNPDRDTSIISMIQRMAAEDNHCVYVNSTSGGYSFYFPQYVNLFMFSGQK